MSSESKKTPAQAEAGQEVDGAEGPENESGVFGERGSGEGASGSAPVEAYDPEELLIVEEEEPAPTPPVPAGPRRGRRRGRRRVPSEQARRRVYTPQQRLLILDSWIRSGLPARDFAGLVGASSHTLYDWKRKFEQDGPAGLEDKPRSRGGSRLDEATKRAILLMKRARPDWGDERIHDMLLRSEGLSASPNAIGRVLKEAGFVTVSEPTRPHPDKPRRFERAQPNQLWQTDLFTFVLKRQNRRVHLVIFMDDFSRFVVGYGLHATASGALVREVFESAIANYGRPEEVLTDNGSQYVTWRGKSAFRKLCERRGIKHVVARPRHPQTLGKAERFWGTLWRECLEAAVFVDLEDGRRRVGHFLDFYNFHRTHRGIGGLFPADRFFRAAPEVKKTLAARVAHNALDLARDGLPRKDFYLTGRVGDVGISLHAEGEQVVLTRDDGSREEVNLAATGLRSHDGAEQSWPEPVTALGSSAPSPGNEAGAAPGTSALDGGLERLGELLEEGARPGQEDEAGGETDVAPSDDVEDGEGVRS